MRMLYFISNFGVLHLALSQVLKKGHITRNYIENYKSNNSIHECLDDENSDNSRHILACGGRFKAKKGWLNFLLQPGEEQLQDSYVQLCESKIHLSRGASWNIFASRGLSSNLEISMIPRSKSYYETLEVIISVSEEY